MVNLDLQNYPLMVSCPQHNRVDLDHFSDVRLSLCAL